MSVHFMSSSGEWGTPRWLFEALDEVFKFTLDVCASSVNAKCEKYFSLEFPKQAFIDSWEDESCWMNPPYGRDIYGWVLKAYMESKDTRAMVGLLPARTDTSWWHEFVYNKRVHVSFIRGRLKFEGARNSAPFPSAIVVWQCNDFSPISKADQILRVEAIARHPKDFQKAFAGAA